MENQTRYYGVVVSGNQLGRTLWFPTANITLDGNVVPPDGVRCAQVSFQDTAYPAVGCYMPNKGVMELHLLDWSGDLYGQDLWFQLLEKLRDNRSFPTLEDLKQQIEEDVRIAKTKLESQ